MTTLLETIRRALGQPGYSGQGKNVWHDETERVQSVYGDAWESRSKCELARLYTSLAEIRIIEDYVSNAIAKIPTKIMRGEGASKHEVKSSSTLSKIRDVANPTQMFSELQKEALVYYGITGNLFLQIHNNYLYTVPTQDVEILLGLGTQIPEHLNFVAGYILEYGGERYVLEEDNVLHMKTTQLEADNGIWAWGTSPYAAALANIEALESIYSSRVSMVQDRGALGMLKNKSQIPNKEATKEVQRALESYGTMRGQRKYIATPEDLEWIQMSLNVEELQLLEQGQADFTRLCEVRGIDANVFSAENSTYENQYAAVENTYRRAIIPTAQQFYSKLKPFTRRHYNGLYFEPDLEYMPEMADTQTKQSVKVMNEVKAEVLSKQQALEMLYPNLEYDKANIEASRQQAQQQAQQGAQQGAGRPYLGDQRETISPNGDGVVQGGSKRQLSN